MAIGRIPEPGTGIPESIIAAKGDLLTGTANDTPAVLTVGANGTTLVADSSETTGLKWATPSIGGITLLSTTSLTGATTTISAIDGTYKNLVAVIYQVTNATADGAFRCAPNGTTNITTGSGTRLDMNQYNESYLFISGPTASTVDRTQNTNAYCLQIFDYANTTYFKPFLLGGNHFQSGHGGVAVNYGGSIKTTSAITSLVFSNSGGNLSTGTVLLYGVK
jgi:hypothetical protein